MRSYKTVMHIFKLGLFRCLLSTDLDSTLVKQANADMQKQFNIKIEIKARIR